MATISVTFMEWTNKRLFEERSAQLWSKLPWLLSGLVWLQHSISTYRALNYCPQATVSLTSRPVITMPSKLPVLHSRSTYSVVMKVTQKDYKTTWQKRNGPGGFKKRYYSLDFHLKGYCTAPEMIPTPNWSPTLKWSLNRPRNDPHFSSRRPRNDPQLLEWNGILSWNYYNCVAAFTFLNHI